MSSIDTSITMSLTQFYLMMDRVNGDIYNDYSSKKQIFAEELKKILPKVDGDAYYDEIKSKIEKSKVVKTEIKSKPKVVAKSKVEKKTNKIKPKVVAKSESSDSEDDTSDDDSDDDKGKFSYKNHKKDKPVDEKNIRYVYTITDTHGISCQDYHEGRSKQDIMKHYVLETLTESPSRIHLKTQQAESLIEDFDFTIPLITKMRKLLFVNSNEFKEKDTSVIGWSIPAYTGDKAKLQKFLLTLTLKQITGLFEEHSKIGWESTNISLDEYREPEWNEVELE